MVSLKERSQELVTNCIMFLGMGVGQFVQVVIQMARRSFDDRGAGRRFIVR